MQIDFFDLAFQPRTNQQPWSAGSDQGNPNPTPWPPTGYQEPPPTPVPHHYHFPLSSKASLSSFIKNQWLSPRVFQPNGNISEWCVKNYRLTDISSQNIFYLFLLESSFNYKLIITIYRTTMKENKKYLLLLFPIRNQIPIKHFKYFYNIKYSNILNTKIYSMTQVSYRGNTTWFLKI